MYNLTLIMTSTPNLKDEPKQKMDLSAVSVSVQLPAAVAIGPTPRVVELPKAHKTPIPRPPLTPPAISYRFSHIFTLYTINFHACQTAIQATTPKPTQEQPRTCHTLHLVQFQSYYTTLADCECAFCRLEAVLAFRGTHVAPSLSHPITPR